MGRRGQGVAVKSGPLAREHHQIHQQRCQQQGQQDPPHHQAAGLLTLQERQQRRPRTGEPEANERDNPSQDGGDRHRIRRRTG